ncbi:uncharacterized protein DNG_02457 [Cephalotrichum gorgonifer]|uniref:Glycosyltransferase family 31 protein n=1 Tax=Cephalotrichum gorgonifer TaxID=2041049 RepID=A0AAE8ST34_9PEZI|nr:uncharacterized protein DNG_02457 [Cephalotrichum gorgonifer]
MLSKPLLSRVMTIFSRVTPRRIRPVHALLILVVISVVFLSRSRHNHPGQAANQSAFTYTDGQTSRPWEEVGTPPPPPRVAPETAWLNDVVDAAGLPKDVRYFSLRIKPELNETRPTMTFLDEPFMHSGFRGVRSDSDVKLAADRTVHLPIAPGPKMTEVDASSLLFAISTSYARLTRDGDAIIRDWTRWLTNGKRKTNGANLVLTLRQADKTQVETISEKLKKAGIQAMVSAEEAADSPTRYMELIRFLAVRTTAKEFEAFSQKKYLAVIDDDTFFPDIGRLLEALKPFNPAEAHYIGMPSERSDWVVDAAQTVTYGGGAVFFTPPAAVKVSQLSCLGMGPVTQDENGQEQIGPGTLGFTSQWDHLLYDCVSSYTGLKMQVLPSFYLPSDEKYGQHFFNYDLGIQPLTLHRPRNRHLLDPGKATSLSPLFNPSTFLQRYNFNDKWVLVNGYTLSHYAAGSSTARLGSPGAPAPNAERRVKNMRPLKPNLSIHEEGRNPGDWDVVTWAGSRRVWNFIDARRDMQTGEVWHAYVRRKDDAGEFTDNRRNEDKSGYDYVIVLIWEPLPEDQAKEA